MRSSTLGHSGIAASLVLFLCPFSGCDAAAAAKGRTQVIEQQIMDLMKKLDSLDERSRMKLISEVDEQRNELLRVLVKYVDTSPSKNVQAAAIYMIGRQRLSDGVGDLVRRIDFEPEQPSRGALPLWEHFPAMEALISIGKPSVRPCLELLATDENDLHRTLAVKVIRYVEGADIALFILQNTVASERDAKRRANLADAQARMQKLVHETR
jgi:hypothetical protein